jgi:hypothetical protein
VGKAAISGWKEVLVPALRSGKQKIVLWPFDGELEEFLRSSRIVIAETYPAEFYRHLGVTFSPSRAVAPSGTRVQAERAANAATLVGWASRTRRRARAEICLPSWQTDFGNTTNGEDRFDAVIGLFGMLNVLLCGRDPGEPRDSQTRGMEGWIFGQGLEPRATANGLRSVPFW